ncbi:MAG: hypothetical protein ABH840_00085 [Nanoarchaeota archaeon]
MNEVKTEIMPETEKLIVDWANYHRYVVNPRKWRTQTVQEMKAMHNLGIFGADIGLGPLDIGSDEKVRQFDELMIGDEAYERRIYVPRGLVVYGFIEYDHSVNSENDLEGFLNSGNQYFFAVEWYLGKELKDWKSDRVPDESRKIRAYGGDSKIITSDGQYVNGAFINDNKTSRERVAELVRLIDEAK